ncbi:FAD-binding oxidoreductase [Phaeobacter sp. C3_T13_0]|uniref:FAD-binding oxidoreductase n=1 Tax=Phaeobacter cretensis TaxID=3342641 RepID=UPI0039BCFEFE
MKIKSDALETLQKAVGAENVATDLATLASYAWNGGVGGMPGPKLKFWPAAVVLPGSTEEVAAIVRACNAHGLKFRPLSSGNGAMHLPQMQGAVMIDLVRMDKIEKIDRKNSMAVIQPYATAGRLMAEAMKVGLTCHVVGAGAGHSPLASATSMLGIGSSGASTGTNARNILGLEWVTPEGEIVRIGTTGEDNWFSEEGPGIGFRGMIRGYMGAHGALGIFTRIGYKLHPWAGDKEMKLTGVFPQAGIEPSNYARFYAPVWDAPEKVAECAQRLSRSGQLFAFLRLSATAYGLVLTPTNEDFVEQKEAGTLPEIAHDENRHGTQIMTQAHSAAQAAYQEKLVKKVVEETGGRFLELDPDHEKQLMRGLVTSQYVARVSRQGGGGATSFGINDSWNLWPKALELAEELVEADKSSDLMCTADVESHWAWVHENRQLWTEHVMMPGHKKPEGTGMAIGSFLRHLHRMDERHLGMRALIGGPIVDLFQTKSKEGVWMRRIKNSIDPNWNADASFYIPPKALPGGNMMPFIRKILFSDKTRPFVNFVLKSGTKGAAKTAAVARKD